MSKPDAADQPIRQPEPRVELPSQAVKEALGKNSSVLPKISDYSGLGIPSDQVLLAQLANPDTQNPTQDKPAEKTNSEDKKDKVPDLLDKLNDRKAAAAMSDQDLASHLAATLKETDFNIQEAALKKTAKKETLTDEEKQQLRLAETADKIMDLAFMRDGMKGLKTLARNLGTIEDGRFKAEEIELVPRLKDEKGKPLLGAISWKVSDGGKTIGNWHYNFDLSADNADAKEIREGAEKLKGIASAGKFDNKQEAANLIRKYGGDKLGAVLAAANYLAGVPDEKGIRPDNSVKGRSRSSSYFAVGEGTADDKHLRFHWLTGEVQPNQP
jgi:hypothetical protein